ncbi:Hypothetical protein FKW44_003829 [Caligus rogercresseyi]|uniref:Uncharacterized protein n=1 Tax=Caligus rogercresseyi TaxID=217165 RepID=A0A7T8QXB1_CALRO|nr:Hypothetical protein FKW44_003829 [Caligus rogercresseyi]
MEIIAADKTLLPIDREEDQSFLLAIRENRPHCLGSLDAKRIRRLKRSAEREQKFANQVEKESKWQKLDEVVPSDDLEKYLPPSQSSPPTKSASASSSPLDPDDPDFIGPADPKRNPKVHDATITLNRETWLRHLHLQSSAKTSNGEVFRMMAATLQAGGFDLDKFAISEEWVRLERHKLDAETAKAIRLKRVK